MTLRFRWCAAMILALVVLRVTPAVAEEVEQWTPASALSQKLFDEHTLKKRWIATEMGLTGAKIVKAVPVLRDRTNKLTGKTRSPVDAIVTNAHGPTYNLDLGKLRVSTYALVVVAMVPTDQLDQWRRPLTLELTVDDQVGGGTTVYRQRIPYWDDFYAVAEIYFNADEARRYSATLRVADGSQTDLDVYSIELHDCLAGLTERASKTRPGTYTLEERRRLRASTKPADVEALVDKEVPLDPYLRGTQELTREERQARDELLWRAVLPINTQYITENDEDWLTSSMAPGKMTQQEALAQYGAWELPAPMYSFRMAWRLPFSLRDTKLGRTYTLDDLVAHRPLPDPYPFKDRGDGIYCPAVAGMAHAQDWMPIASALGWWWEGSRLALAPYHGFNVDRRLPYLYMASNNQHAARDAAFMLARWAYLYPALTDAQALGFAVVAPGPLFNRDDRLRWRRFGYTRSANLTVGLLHSYDQLFDYIKGNQELAQAVGKYIPWIKTDEDLRRMIETRLVQYAAKQLLRWQRWDDKDTPTWLMLAAAIQQDPGVTRPWMKQLWEATWVYPSPVAGVPELISTTTQRNGSTTIGSVSYTQSGSPFAELVELSHRYVMNGGEPTYDLENLQLYAKLGASTRFSLEASIAGGFPLTIGDVGAIDKPRILDQVQTFSESWRRGWEWTRDARLAWLIVNYLGRTTESAREWDDLAHAAATYGRNPFLSQHSRVLANWAGIVEAGEDSDDYRFKRTAYLRVGTGYGHSHSDTLDLQLQAHGVRMAGDLGWRGEYSQPSADSTLLHNRLEVDDTTSSQQGNWQGHSWIRELLPLTGAQYMVAQAVPPVTHATTRSYKRSIALIDAAPGTPAVAPHRELYRGGATPHARSVVEPDSYVFDVQRIAGGTYHTWCFHGPWADRFDINMEHRHEVGPASTDKSSEASYLRKFLDGKALKLAGTVPDASPLEVTWRLRRTEDKVAGTNPHDGKPVLRTQHNPEKEMLGVDYDDTGSQKFLRTYLLGHRGETVLVADPVPIGPEHSDSTWPFVFVRKSNDQPIGSVYAAIHEPYADHPFITQVRPLEVGDGAGGADQTVAVEVTMTNGRKDWLYSDGDPSGVRQVGSATVQAAFAMRSDDTRGVRMLEVIDGRSYDDGTLGVELEVPDRMAAIEKVDYLDRRIWIRSDAPAALWLGQQIEIGNDAHRTSFGVVSARRDGARLVLGLDDALDLSYAKVKELSADHLEVVADIGPVDVATYPGMQSGLTLTNQDMSRSWKVKRVIGDQPGRGYVYSLAGAVDAVSLKPGSTLRLWELGVGDTVRIPSYVQLGRIDAGPDAGRYEVTADAAVTLRRRGYVAVQVTAAQLALHAGKVVVDLR